MATPSKTGKKLIEFNCKNGVYAVNDAEIQLSDKQREFNAQLEQTISYLTQAAARASSLGGMITTGLQGFSTIAMGINSVSNAIKTLGDDSAGFGQKLTALAMGLTMGFSALKTVIAGVGGSITILSNGKNLTTRRYIPRQEGRAGCSAMPQTYRMRPQT